MKSAGETIGVLPAPGAVHPTLGDFPGEVDLSWPGMRGAKSFVIQIATVPEPVEADWKLALVSTKSRCTVGGLTTDERYWFRVAAVGAAGQSPWSPTATGKAS